MDEKTLIMNALFEPKVDACPRD